MIKKVKPPTEPIGMKLLLDSNKILYFLFSNNSNTYILMINQFEVIKKIFSHILAYCYLIFFVKELAK